MLEFFIIVTGYNCSGYIKSCYNSLISQDYSNWTAIFVDDGSTTDNIRLELNEFLVDDRCKYIVNAKNLGAAYSRHKAITTYKPTKQTVIVFLGMDDELLPTALSVIAEQYEAGKLMTYGNWHNQKGVMNRMSLYFDYDTHTKRDYRKVKYRSTAPNTFKKLLYDKIPEKDLMIDGQWPMVCTEGEVMLSCLEMCGRDRIGVIGEPIYLYREGLANGTLRRFGRDFKYSVYAKIAARKKRKLL